MKKDKKFLLELEQQLNSINKKKRDVIVLKYREIIDEKIKEKKKIKDILKELGTPEQIAEKELELIKNNKKINFDKIKSKTKKGIKSIYNGITKDIQIGSKDKKQKDEIKEKDTKEEKITSTELKEIKIKENKKEEKNKKISKKEIKKKVEEEDQLIKERIKKSLENTNEENDKIQNNRISKKKDKKVKEKIINTKEIKEEIEEPKVEEPKENKLSKLKDKFKNKEKEESISEEVSDTEEIKEEIEEPKVEEPKENKLSKLKEKFKKKEKEESISEEVSDTEEIKEEIEESKVEEPKENKLSKLKDKFKKKEKENIFDDESNNQIEEICDITEIVTETPFHMSKKDKTKKIIIEMIGVVTITILLFIWMWISVLFLASLFAYLDGIKLYGLSIALLGLVILSYWITIMINRMIFKKKNNYKRNLIIVISSVFVIAIGIALLIYQTSKLEIESDVSQKYTMTTKYDTYLLPSDEKEKMYIFFNSNYDTQYMVKYDDNLEGKFKLEVKYYENYYDYNLKKSSNNLYVSLSVDSRDRISAYIDDFKENKIYNKDELARYIVKITINEKDYQRLVIEN